MKLASRLGQLVPSGIRKIVDEALSLERQGKNISHLEIGRPHFSAPPIFCQAMCQAIEKGELHYVPNRGPLDARQSLSRFLKAERNLTYSADDELIFTVGASEGVAVAMLTCLDATSEVIVPTPAWPHYQNCAILAGARVVELPLRAANQFQISIPELRSVLTDRTRMIVLCNPSNPVGAIQSLGVMQELLKIAQERDLIIVADEIYDAFVFDQNFTNFASLPGAKEHTISLNGFSKCMGITGARVGYMAAPPKLALQLNTIHQYLTVCAAAPALSAVRDTLDHSSFPAHLQEVRRDYRQRRDLCVEMLSRCSNLKICGANGAMYIFVEYDAKFGNDFDVASKILHQARVAIVPGSVFGKDFTHHFRLAYTCQLDELKDSLRRIMDFFA